MVASYEFGLTFHQVKGVAVGFGKRAGEEEDEAQGLIPDIPIETTLLLHDLSQAQGPGNHQQGNEGKSQGYLITDILGSCPDCTQKRIFIVGGPAADHDPVYPKSHHPENVQDPDIHIGYLQGNGTASDLELF